MKKFIAIVFLGLFAFSASTAFAISIHHFPPPSKVGCCQCKKGAQASCKTVSSCADCFGPAHTVCAKTEHDARVACEVFND